MSEASAPASSANLGPGFDVLALAIELRCRVRAERAEVWSVDHEPGQRPSADADDAVLAAARAVAANSGYSFNLWVRNEIPIGRGLGSSAAALAAGAAATMAAMGDPIDQQALFELVSEIEGHPDNAAAAVYGGLVLVSARGRPLQIEIHPSLRPLIAVPQEVFFTVDARRAVADTVSREVAVRTIARAAALVGGLATADPALLAAADGDELHEVPRSLIRPETEKLLAAARSAGALHAAWSGSGPSVIALVGPEREEDVAAAMGSEGAEVLSLEVAREGLLVSA